MPLKTRDLDTLLEKLEFGDETISDAVLEQASLYMASADYRIEQMRKRMRKELHFDRIRAHYALEIRNNHQGKKTLTEAHIKEQLEEIDEYLKVRKELEELEVAEKWAELLVRAYEMRRDALKMYVQMTGGERELQLTGTAAKVRRQVTDRLTRERPEEE